MAAKPIRMETDVVIAGSGPGGATVARGLSKAGKKVIILEKGPWVKKVGNLMVFVKATENKGQLKTIEDDGSVVFSAKCVGGGSLLYMGAAADPQIDVWKKHGIDLTQYVAQAKKDCRVNKVPDHLIAPGVKRLVAAAHECGYPWQNLERFFDPAKCKLNCQKCITGCPAGSKWTAIEFVQEAEKNGAIVMPNVNVRNVIVENGTAVGMRARGKNGQEYEVYGKIVVSSAGGMGTARILQRSGIPEAGSWFIGDPTVSVTGFLKEGVGQVGELGISAGWHDEEHGVFFANAYTNRSMFMATQFMGPHKLRAIKNQFRFKKGMEIMCKVTDDFEGRVFYEEGKLSKRMTPRDLMRLDHGKAVAEKILTKAGCDPTSFEYTDNILGHPGGTARVGKLVDSNFQTQIKNLYCCDTSVIPEELGLPPMLTIVAFSLRMAQHLESVLSKK
ncbi:MAG: GMC family oxidoreductase N-terminal domain-containing protein [Dehalococcoidia bacterium]|nr:GMC family oxidoreductase N-terminal domain-containing protein [Dehalococcoidia bacterium]